MRALILIENFSLKREKKLMRRSGVLLVALGEEILKNQNWTNELERRRCRSNLKMIVTLRGTQLVEFYNAGYELIKRELKHSLEDCAFWADRGLKSAFLVKKGTFCEDFES